MKTVTAADANRHFSRVIREVTQGEAFVVVSRGKAVATIGPAQKMDAERQRAQTALLGRLRKQSSIGARNWTREELYEGGT